MGKLDGKVAIVTGASRGIGAAIVKKLHEEGATVVACARSIESCEGAAFWYSLRCGTEAGGIFRRAREKGE